MSEEKPNYQTVEQPAAIIQAPQKGLALFETLEDYKIWGWVKLSAKFRPHIKRLKGAKIAIWLCIALSIEEDGSFAVSLKDLEEFTGYSHTEIISSIAEMEDMGYLSVDRNGRKNIYKPVFVARGDNRPSESLVKKVESTPQYQVESSPAIEKMHSSISRVKELDILDAEMKFNLKPTSIRQAVHEYFRLNVNWETKTARQWMEWAVGENMTPDQLRTAAELWRTDKRFNWQPPTLKGIFEKWPMLTEPISVEIPQQSTRLNRLEREL